MMDGIRRLFSAFLPYRPAPGGRDEFERAYSRGDWAYLRDLSELARFSVLAGYCHALRPGAKILDVGCGEGILRERLDSSRIAGYVGIDIAPTAIDAARKIADDRCEFAVADAMLYCPTRSFDIVVFNECLEYFADPVTLVGRYEPHLRPRGLFLVSQFLGMDSQRSRKIWRALEPHHRTIDETQVSNRQGYRWTIRVLAPRHAGTADERTID